jgi:hypothetical protein
MPRARLRRRHLVQISIVMVIGWITPLLQTTPASAGVNTNLSCYGAWAADLPDTNTWGVSGTSVGVHVGANANFGGIGTQLGLSNLANGSPYVDVLEARSGTGAGWQTSYWLKDPSSDKYIVFNQAAGNSIGYQWGYKNSFPGTAALDWNPIVSDHLQHGGLVGPQTNFSPCAGTGYMFDYGKVHYGLGTSYTILGNAVALTNQYQLQSQYNQFWSQWALEQAMYLSKNVATMGNLRMYFAWKNGTHTGPVYPYQNSFSVPGASSSACGYDGCQFHLSNLSYMVMVWNIFGLDVGVAIPTSSIAQPLLNTETHTYCADVNNPVCGSISLHLYQTVENNHSRTTGQVNSYGVDYRVGTNTQLGLLGFTY